MPSSHLQWSPVKASSPIFQVFGAKRKAQNDEPSGMALEENPDGFPAKRRCIAEDQPSQPTFPLQQQYQQPLPFGSFQQQQQQQPPSQADLMEVNHNDVLLPSLQQQQQQQQQPRVPSPWPSQQALSAMQPPPAPEQPGQGIMELSDETFNTEAAQSAMESDYVPDTQQYAVDPQFCKEYCGQGSVSPNSGRVRCYCKPSWEGMLDTSPYISDVY